MRNTTLLLGLLACSAAPAVAQQSYAIPQSPAFTFLDVSPSKIERPSTARDFAAALQNGIDESGKVLQGFALEAAPWTWLPKLSIPVADYAKTGKYILANLSMSLGSTRATGDTASTNLALGLRTTIYDRSDPMTDPAFVNSLRNAIVECNTSLPENTPNEVVRMCAARHSNALRTKWLSDNWNKGSLSVALAGGARLRNSHFDDVNFAGISGWGAWAMQLASNGQFIVQARVDRHAAVDTANGFTAVRAGARAVFGSSRANGFLELEHNNQPTSVSKGTTGWSGGVEFRASDDLWLSTGFGRGYKPSDSQRVVLLANIRWRVSNQAALAPN